MKPCKDCIADLLNVEPRSGWRPAPHPGPRCTTHHRAWVKRSKGLAHARTVESTYEITAEEYWAIYAFQGGRCAICAHATGKSKRLAVDHDHKMALECGHDPNHGCRRCIRGLLCSRCNRWGVPLFLEAVIRAINYLTDPPARKVLQQVA